MTLKWPRSIQGFLDRGLVPIVMATTLLSAIYLLSSWLTPGWGTYLLSLPASLLIFITAVARLNDIKPAQTSKRWQIRRAGLVLAGMGAAAYATVPFQDIPLWPTWKAVVLLWGVATSWFTTPNMPPWWKYITGEFRQKEIKSGV